LVRHCRVLPCRVLPIERPPRVDESDVAASDFDDVTAPIPPPESAAGVHPADEYAKPFLGAAASALHHRPHPTPRRSFKQQRQRRTRRTTEVLTCRRSFSLLTMTNAAGRVTSSTPAAKSTRLLPPTDPSSRRRHP